jgi:hypothetical protein
VRGRVALSAVLAAAVVAAGVAFDRVLGPKPPAEAGFPAASTTSGGWFCPHGGGEGWRAWIVAANPGRGQADVTITTFGRRRPQEAEEVVPPGTQRYFEVPAEGMASASVLEFYGTSVYAGMVTRRADGAGLAAEPCAAEAAQQWYVPEGTSVRGQAAHVVVVNPFAQEAVVDVTIVTDADVIRHGNLTGVVVEPHQARAFDLNRFALGEESLVAEVHAALGRVAVAGLGVGKDAGLRSVLGVDDPATSWVFPGAADADPTNVMIAAPTESVPLRVLTQDAKGSTVVLEEESVAGRSAETFEVPQEGAGVLVEGEGPTPFVAGRRLAPTAPDEPPTRDRRRDRPRDRGRRNGGRDRPEEAPPADLASTAGLPGGGRAWVSLSPLPEDGGTSTVVLQNPGRTTARGRMLLVGEDGPLSEPVDFSLQAGHTVADGTGEKPVSLFVRLTSGQIAVAQVATVDGGFAVSAAIPVEPATTPQTSGIRLAVG